MERIEFSDNAYLLMKQTGVGQGVVEQIVRDHERDIERQGPDSAEAGIRIAEEPQDGYRVRVVYSTKPQKFGEGYGSDGDAVVLSTNVLPRSDVAVDDG